MTNKGILSNFANTRIKRVTQNMARKVYDILNKSIILACITLLFLGFSSKLYANQKKEFVVVIDAGHGGKDVGAVGNGVREKDINLAVAKRTAELIDKKINNCKVILTRNNDSFISLQNRADVANKAGADLFISIHTNSVDNKNPNRASIEGASVYTLGPQKEDANKEVARRENSVIELEADKKEKYSDFDPNKDESYILFEMGHSKNQARSIRFAQMVEQNLIKIAGRKNRGVNQAGFWVLWATSMPSVLIELDFICNPQSANFLTSKDGVNKLSEAIFEAVKAYEKNYREELRIAENKKTKAQKDAEKKAHAEAKKNKKQNKNKSSVEEQPAPEPIEEVIAESLSLEGPVGLAFTPEAIERDMSHTLLKSTRNQPRAKHASDGRKRRSQRSKIASENRNVEGKINLRSEYTGQLQTASTAQVKDNNAKESNQANDSKNQKNKTKKKSSKKVSTKKYADSKAVATKKSVKTTKQNESAEKESSEQTSNSNRKPVRKASIPNPAKQNSSDNSVKVSSDKNSEKKIRENQERERKQLERQQKEQEKKAKEVEKARKKSEAQKTKDAQKASKSKSDDKNKAPEKAKNDKTANTQSAASADSKTSNNKPQTPDNQQSAAKRRPIKRHD